MIEANTETRRAVHRRLDEGGIVVVARLVRLVPVSEAGARTVCLRSVQFSCWWYLYLVLPLTIDSIIYSD